MHERNNIQSIVNKLSKLPPAMFCKVEDYIDVLNDSQDDDSLALAKKASESTFEKIWLNSEDEVYDKL